MLHRLPMFRFHCSYQLTLRRISRLGQIKKIGVFTVTCQKNLGSVGRHLFFILLSAKPKIFVPSSGIRFWYFIFEISGTPSFVEAVFINYDELRSFSTFFALNFDKKLAVE
jgi:hypothetical protein